MPRLRRLLLGSCLVLSVLLVALAVLSGWGTLHIKHHGKNEIWAYFHYGEANLSIQEERRIPVQREDLEDDLRLWSLAISPDSPTIEPSQEWFWTIDPRDEPRWGSWLETYVTITDGLIDYPHRQVREESGRFILERKSNGRYFHMPLLGLAALAAFPPATAIVRRLAGRRKPGTCPACGYDLHATVGRCPECGHEPETDIPPRACLLASMLAVIGIGILIYLLLAVTFPNTSWGESEREWRPLRITYSNPGFDPYKINSDHGAGLAIQVTARSVALVFSATSIQHPITAPIGLERSHPPPLTGLPLLEPMFQQVTTRDGGHSWLLRVPIWLPALLILIALAWWVRRLRARGGLYFWST